MKKISEENLTKIINFIGTNTTTNVGYPLIQMINTFFTDCECEMKTEESKTEE